MKRILRLSFAGFFLERVLSEFFDSMSLRSDVLIHLFHTLLLWPWRSAVSFAAIPYLANDCSKKRHEMVMRSARGVSVRLVFAGGRMKYALPLSLGLIF